MHRQDTTESSNLNYLDTKFNALEPTIQYNSKAVSTELYEKFNSDTSTFLKIKHSTKYLSKYIFPK